MTNLATEFERWLKHAQACDVPPRECRLTVRQAGPILWHLGGWYGNGSSFQAQAVVEDMDRKGIKRMFVGSTRGFRIVVVVP